MTMLRFAFIATATLTLSMSGLTSISCGDVIISLSDEAGGTRVNVSGSLNTTGLSFNGPFSTSILSMQAKNSLFFTGAPGSYRWASHGQTLSPWHDLSEDNLSFSDVSGIDFGFNFSIIVIGDGYVSGTTFNTSYLIDGQSLASINPQNGVVLTLSNGDSVSVSAVPEPSLGLVFLGAFGLLLRTRRKIEGND